MFSCAGHSRASAPAARLFHLLYDSDQPAGACSVTPGEEAATLWRAPGSPHEPLWHTLLKGVPYVRALGSAIPAVLGAARLH